MPEAVSVIITCFSLERFIASTIQSVLEQDYSGPIEIIVVDDCSTDNSAAIISGFRGVRYLRTDRNSGVLLAMIAGIKAASHDIVLLLDGDDLWLPQKVRLVAEAFAHNPRRIFVTHDILCVDDKDEPLPIPSRPAKRMPTIPPEEVSDAMRRASMEMGDFICLGSAVSIRRSLADIEGFIRFAEALPDPVNTYQDWPLVSWCAIQPGTEFAYIPQVLYRYRIHQSNYSGDASSVAKATRNLTRTYNSINAMIDIAVMADADPAIVVSLRNRRHPIRYLLDLVSGNYGAALKSFARSLPDLKKRGLLLKESVRFLAVLAVGPRQFLQLSSRRRLFKFIRTT